MTWLLRAVDRFALRLRERLRFFFPFCRCFTVFLVPFVGTTTDGDGCGLPLPDNVALAGAPKIAGCGSGAGLHASALEQAGGDAGACTHPTALEQVCASYTSKLEVVVLRCEPRRRQEEHVFGFFAGRALPARIEERRFFAGGSRGDQRHAPPERSPNVGLDDVQLPMPDGSYS